MPFIVYGSALGFGSGLAALGAAVSSLAAGLEVPDTSVGQFFTCRGLGVMAGALISAKLMDAPSYFSKHFICSMAIVVAGVSLAAVPLLVESYGGIMMNVVRFLFLAEGLSFGFVESYSTIAIAEMWGQRQQPWMQMKNLMSGSGAILAPVLIGKFGYTWAFCLIALIGFVSIIGLIAENIVLFLVLQRTSPEKWEVIEQKHLPFDESESKQEHLPLSPINLHGQINAFEAACTSQFSCQAPLEPLDQSILHAKELNILTDSLVAIDENEELDMPVWHDLVEGILDHTEYHVLPQDTQPIDHSQANVNRTLSFATPQIVEYIQDRPKEFNVNLLSNFVRMTLAFFVCWHIGLLYSYGGWIGTYIVMRGIEGPQHHGSLGAGLQITTLYYICQTVGSIYSVPASVMFSTTTLMRFQLFLLIAGTSLLFFTFSPYYFTAISACTMGLSLSCIYPLAMTVVNDYGGTM